MAPARQPGLVGDLGEQPARVDLGQVERDQAGVEPAEVEQVGDDVGEPLGLAERPVEGVGVGSTTPSARFSSVARSAATGVRSSWETVATSSRRRRSSVCSSWAITLNARARSPISSEAVVVTRVE